MKGSLKLGKLAGIGVYMHWTFLLLLAWILFAGLQQGQTMSAALAGVGFVMALFACVVLHELGHALTARKYQIRTLDITLLPIGGVARLERMPDNPAQEFWVAIAGPAVNLAIAGFLFVLGLAVGGFPQLANFQLLHGQFLGRLMWLNLFLMAFNLLPAFPMDGGRVLRALLARTMGRLKATRIAAQVGQTMAVLFGIYGFLANPFLIFIAIFVYLGAQAEAQMVEITSSIQGLSVQDAMLTRYRTLGVDDTLDRAVTELLAGSQQDFPVMEDGRVAGILRRNDLVGALANGGRERKVGAVVSNHCPKVDAASSLESAFETMRRENLTSVPVFNQDRLVGLLTLENVGELIMVRNALNNVAHPAATPAHN